MTTTPGELQQAAGVWDDFDDDLRTAARVFLGTLGTAGAAATIHRNTPADWYGLRMILGTRLTDKLRESTNSQE